MRPHVSLPQNRRPTNKQTSKDDDGNLTEGLQGRFGYVETNPLFAHG